MRSPSALIGWPLLVLLAASSAILAADSSNNHASPLIAAQSSDPGNLPVPAKQPNDGSSPSLPTRQPAASGALEIGPQPSSKTPSPDNQETQEQRAFRRKKEDEIAKLDRNFHPHDSQDSRRPYLGFDLEETAQCYLGVEEHGFEVVNIYPNSPAARAGLIARTGSTPSGELKALGSILLGPVALVTFPLLRASGALGMGGDLIVAVDDVRVRTREEILHEFGHLKPGDTTYITVIRPLHGGYHQTMRIAIHIDNLTDAAGNILPSNGTAPSAAPSPATESAVN